MRIKLLIFALIFCVPAFAQNWQSIKTDGITHFYNEDAGIFPIRIDSTYQHGDTTDYFGFRMIREYPIGSWQFTMNGGHWTGNKFSFLPDGTNVFYNSVNREISINTLAEPGDTWVMYQYQGGNYIEAKVTAKEMGEILGQSDSIKTIQLSIKDSEGNDYGGSCCVDSIYMVNSCYFQLSKNYGFTTITDFYNFPFTPSTMGETDLYLMSNSYQLVGISNPPLGYQNITNKDVFLFHTGDEIHTIDGDSNFGPDWCYYYFKLIRRYLESTISINQDTVTYKEERCSCHVSTDANGEEIYTSHDTVEYTVVFSNMTNLYFDKLAMEPFNDNDWITWYDASLTSKIESVFIFYPVEDNLEILNYEGGGHCEYIVGLGGPYNCGDGDSPELIYYKVNNAEWGTPYDCDELLLVGIDSDTKAADFSVYPNPANEVIIIESGFSGVICHYKLFNFVGQLVFENNFTDKTTIDATALLKGVYMLSLSNGKTINQQRIVIQ